MPAWRFTVHSYHLLQWDTYRTLYPLMSLHDPERFAEIVRGLIDIQRHEGETLFSETVHICERLYHAGCRNVERRVGNSAFGGPYFRPTDNADFSSPDIYKAEVVSGFLVVLGLISSSS